MSSSSDSDSNLELEKQSRWYFLFSLSIFSSHSLQSLICSAYLSGMSNNFLLFCGWDAESFSACWLLCDWGCWRVCGCGHWRFCSWGFCVVWGWRFWGHILGWLCRLPSQSSSLCSSSFLQMEQCSPHEHFSVACLVMVMAWGIAANLGCSSVLMVGLGLGTGVGGIDESFLVSNRFYDGKLVLGQGVPCLTGALGISSSCGGLSLMDLVVGCGTLANCHMASLCIVTGIDSAVDLTIDVCVLIVTTVGGSWGWVGRCRVGEYPHLVPFLAIIVFLLLTLTLGAGDFLTLGLVLG